MSPHTQHSANQERPSGREAIMVAVLDAATELFSTKPPSAVSVRDIARTAGVQHSVVHRYFGSKEDLLRAVIEHGSQLEAEHLADMGTMDPAERLERSLERAPFMRTILLASMEGRDPAELLPADSIFKDTVAFARTQGVHPHGNIGPRYDPRVLVAFVAAATFGWQAAEDTLMYATGIDDRDPRDVRAEIAELMAYLIQLAAQPGA